MKRFSEQFKKKSEKIRMRASERRELRDRIVSYMEYHPMLQTSTLKKRSTKTISKPFTIISINKIYTRSFAGVFTAFLIIAVPLLAERAVPGDVLYSVKVQFNEEVRSTLAFSPYAKVVWETQRIERRIAEARLLADEGKLTQKIEAEVALAVQVHTNAAQQEIAVLRENDSDEADIATIAFASALAVQSEMLDGQVEQEINDGDGDHSVVTLAGVVAEVWRDAEVAQFDVWPSYEKLLARIEMDTTLAYELFTSVRIGATAEEVSDVERRLSDVQRKVSEAIALHENGLTNLSQEPVVADDEMIVNDIDKQIVEIINSAETEEVIGEEIIPVTPDKETVSEEITKVTEISGENREVESVDNLVENDTSQEVITLLRDALTDTQKLIGFLADIDVRSNVTIEDLVPVTLTDKENITRIQSRVEEAESLKKEVESREVFVEISEKVSTGIDMLTASLEKTSVALASGDFDTAETASVDALAIAQNLNVLTGTVEVLEGTDDVAEENDGDEIDTLGKETSTSTESRVDVSETEIPETNTLEESPQIDLEEGV